MAKGGKKTKKVGTAEGVRDRDRVAGKSKAPAEEEARAAEVADGSADTSFTVALRAGQGFVLSALDPRSTPGFTGGKVEAAALMASTDHELDDLQERLYAESRTGGNRSLLLVVQGMDTSGKGGIMRHVVGSVDPQGVHITSFKAPTEEERKHDFLWRIRRALPAPGMIGVFDRSHYEDVLIARVHELIPAGVVEQRYDQINAFEREVADAG